MTEQKLDPAVSLVLLGDLRKRVTSTRGRGQYADLQEKLFNDIYTVLAAREIDRGDRRLLRLYVLQARRESQSWSVELSFDSAGAPGMSHDLVEQSDDPRATAVFADLCLTHEPSRIASTMCSTTRMCAEPW